MSKSKHVHYNRWKCMIQRCHNAGNCNYRWYGARGIRVYPEWRTNFWAYAAYLDSMGGCPDGWTLDRIDNDGHYEPGNMRWANLSTQNANKRRRA